MRRSSKTSAGRPKGKECSQVTIGKLSWFVSMGEASAGKLLVASDGRCVDGAAHPPNHPLAPTTSGRHLSADRRMKNLAGRIRTRSVDSPEIRELPERRPIKIGSLTRDPRFTEEFAWSSTTTDGRRSDSHSASSLSLSLGARGRSVVGALRLFVRPFATMLEPNLVPHGCTRRVVSRLVVVRLMLFVAVQFRWSASPLYVRQRSASL